MFIAYSKAETLLCQLRSVKAMVFPVVMYGCESWTVKKAEHRRIDAFAQSTGVMQVRHDVSPHLAGRHVVILEDILDTGRSLTFTRDHLLSKGAASVKICTLLDKPEGRLPGYDIKADYVGFTIPNAFVVGYGLDYNEKYRNLPYVGILKPEVYEK